MEIAFRVDASIQIGIGHVMRCITLAESLKKNGHNCFFLCRSLQGDLTSLIQSKGFTLFLLKTDQEKVWQRYQSKNNNKYDDWLQVSWEIDAEQTEFVLKQFNVDWLIVDHYALDSKWEEKVAKFVKKIMVIDDLANRTHICNLLLDQTFGRKADSYSMLVPKTCEVICGSEYALLRPQFSELRHWSLQRREHPRLRKILISMGGVDKNNVSLRILKALTKCNLPNEIQVTVVLGFTSPWANSIRHQARLMPWETHVMIGVNDMANLMAQSDFAIGGAGSSSWERCCLGLPSITVILATNQIFISNVLLKAGASLSLNADQISKNLPLKISLIVNGMSVMSCAASSLVDGLGAGRVVDKLLRFQ